MNEEDTHPFSDIYISEVTHSSLYSWEINLARLLQGPVAGTWRQTLMRFHGISLPFWDNGVMSKSLISSIQPLTGNARSSSSDRHHQQQIQEVEDKASIDFSWGEVMQGAAQTPGSSFPLVFLHL